MKEIQSQTQTQFSRCSTIYQKMHLKRKSLLIVTFKYNNLLINLYLQIKIQIYEKIHSKMMQL